MLEQGNTSTNTKKKLENLLDRNVFDPFALLLPLDYKLINDVKKNMSFGHVQGGSNMTGTDLCVNKPHCAAAVRP